MQGEKIEKNIVNMLMNSSGSYEYPFSYTTHLNFTIDGLLEIKIRNVRSSAYLDTSTMAILTPVISTLI